MPTTKVLPVRLENAQKSVLLSFAAVWSRAVALKRGQKKGDHLAALTLVHNPSFDRQRPLWAALDAANKQGFFEYFRLKGVKAVLIYTQWQEAFNALRRGRELGWQEIVSATENLLAAIGGIGKPESKPRGKRVTRPGKRPSRKDRVSQLGNISEAEAEDILGIISGFPTKHSKDGSGSANTLQRLPLVISNGNGTLNVTKTASGTGTYSLSVTRSGSGNIIINAKKKAHRTIYSINGVDIEV